MGYSISWIGTRGRPVHEILGVLKLAGTGKFEESPDSRISATTLPGGWFLIFANDCNFADRAPLKKLSKGCEVVACAVEEEEMASGACAFADGVATWCVTHDPAHGVAHLHVTGEPPGELPEIRKRLLSKQQEDGSEDSEVDYVFDVPAELAAKVVGFHHDRGHGVSYEVLAECL